MTKEFTHFLDRLVKGRNIAVDKKYYAASYQDNIFPDSMAENHIRMFCRGGGKELFPQNGQKEKAACVYSSSMLSYNFFHWIDAAHPLVFDGIEYDKVVFEEQFRVLANRNNKANLDVVLVSKDKETILLLESKFTEHLNTGKVEIADAYLHPDSYYDSGGQWAKIMKNLVDRQETEDKYFGGIKQVACHLMGISSVIRNRNSLTWFNKNSWIKNQFGLDLKGSESFIFKSLVFLPDIEENCAYIEDNKAFFSSLPMKGFLPDNLLLDDPIITYRDLWDCGMKKSLLNNLELTNYLEQFLSVHA